MTGDPATIVLRGRKVVGGRAEGEALVTRESDSRLGRREPANRVSSPKRITSCGQELQGQGARVSRRQGIVRLVGDVSHGAAGRRRAKALVFNEMTTKVALGAVVMRVPSVTDLDRDPLDLIETGDWVTVDGDLGIVEIQKVGR